MKKIRFPLTAFWLALSLSMSGCATTGTGGPDAKADKQAVAIEGARVVSPGAVPSYPEDPLARRLPAKVMRIWIAPWEDSRGDLHAPGYLYTKIEPRRWTIGGPAEAERVTLIRPLQIERRDTQPSSTRSGRDTGAMRKPGKTKAPESGQSARELTNHEGARGTRDRAPGKARQFIHVNSNGETMKHMTKPTLLGFGALALAGLMMATPETMLAGAGGTEL
jgi:hypothetical protein